MTDAFLFAAEAVLPIVLLIVLGYVLKRRGMLNKPFLDVGNKLTFRVLLPVMLFCNVYKIDRLSDVNVAFVLYGIGAVIILFLAAIAVCCAFTKDNAKRGSLIQSVFRSNYAIIGIPLAASLFGDKGAAAAGVMSAFCVPTFNILGVITLVIFNGNEEKQKADIKKIFLGVVKNPLIIGTVTGLAVLGIREIFVKTGISFRLSDVTVLFKTLENIKSICTPLALIVLGGKFEFSAVSRLRREIIFGTLVRTVAVPVIGLGTALLLKNTMSLSGEHFATYMGVFATPVAVASAIMAKEMGADDELAGQLVVWTSLVSTVTIFIYVTVLRIIGIF
ncbi:MAG: AEC family transporter [Ruminococcus albus]|uniref:AEC family transporter n=1 Tax=Ruminococcus sp. TaxID=41978 RepID=UPI0025DDD12F|nr:AEC family transporter [Ruminococcus sp.]MBE6872593.1 AEC family transporter [Ruminococcus albus]MBR0529827.1 AEC family transporter [Ruminococcus sp.]